MILKTDIVIGDEQAKIFAQYVYDDFIEYINSQEKDKFTDDKNNKHLEVH